MDFSFLRHIDDFDSLILDPFEIVEIRIPEGPRRDARHRSRRRPGPHPGGCTMTTGHICDSLATFGVSFAAGEIDNRPCPRPRRSRPPSPVCSSRSPACSTTAPWRRTWEACSGAWSTPFKPRSSASIAPLTTTSAPRPGYTSGRAAGRRPHEN